MRKKTVLLNAKLIGTSFGNTCRAWGRKEVKRITGYFGDAWVISLMFMW